MPILWVFETDVFVVLKGLFAIDKVENRLFRIYFHDLRHGSTGVTRGYRGLRGVIGCYNGLQGATGGYKGLQEVTWG